jgi:hypothetical protein
VQSKGSQTLIPLTMKKFKGAKQDHPDGARKVDGAELRQVMIVGNGLRSRRRARSQSSTSRTARG